MIEIKCGTKSNFHNKSWTLQENLHFGQGIAPRQTEQQFVGGNRPPWHDTRHMTWKTHVLIRDFFPKNIPNQFSALPFAFAKFPKHLDASAWSAESKRCSKSVQDMFGRPSQDLSTRKPSSQEESRTDVERWDVADLPGTDVASLSTLRFPKRTLIFEGWPHFGHVLSNESLRKHN